MEAALSFNRVWVRIVHCGGKGLGRQQRQQCDCLDRPLSGDVNPPDCCSKCVFVAAEVGVTETVSDLKSMLQELMPSCFHTNYDLLLRPRARHLAEGSEKGLLLLQDSYSFANLSVQSGEVIDLVPRPWDPRSAFHHLRRLAEVLFDPKAIVLPQLPDAADPCGAFGALLRPIVLQQLAPASADPEGGNSLLGCSEGRHPEASLHASGSLSGRKQRNSRRKGRGEKCRLRAAGVSWGESGEEKEPDAIDASLLLLGLGEEMSEDEKWQQKQLLLLQKSLLPSPLKPKHKLLAFIRVYPGGHPTPAAQLAGHVMWIEAETLEGLRLFIASTEKGFCVSSLRRADTTARTAAGLSLFPAEAFPLQLIASPDGQSLPIKEAANELLFDTLAHLLSAYSTAFADGVPLLAPEPLDADLPLHAMPSLQPFLPPFATELERSQARPLIPDNQLLGREAPGASACRLWGAEAAALLGGPPASDFSQGVASERLASKVYAEFREAALHGAVALRERRLLPLGGQFRSSSAAAATASAGTPAAVAPWQVYVHNNILLVADREPLALSCCGGPPFERSVGTDVAAREALRKVAEAAEVARLCEDAAVAAAAAAASASLLASVAPPGAGMLCAQQLKQQQQQRRPIAVAVDFAGCRILCQGVEENALARYCFGEASAATAAQAHQQEQQPECTDISSSVAQLLGVRRASSISVSQGFDALTPLDVVAAPFGLKETPGELAAAAASAAARHFARAGGEAAVAAAAAASAAAAAEVNAAAAAAGLTEGPSHATARPDVRPELLRAFLAFRSRQIAYEKQQQQQQESSSSDEGKQKAFPEADDGPPTLEEELERRLQKEISSQCSSITRELLRAGSWFDEDSKGGANGISNRLQRLQQLTLACCNETVLRCMDRAKEQQETLLLSRREDIEMLRAAIERQLQQKEQQQQQQQQQQQHQNQDAKEGERMETCAAATPAGAASLTATEAATEMSKVASDVALLSLLGEDVSLLQEDCDLQARASSVAAEACRLTFPPPPGVSTAGCLLLGVGTEALPLNSEHISAADKDSLMLLAAYLRQVAVPLASSMLSVHHPGSSPPLDSQSLKAFLHRYGLNCRHIGAVFRTVQTASLGGDSSLPLLLLERDILLRCAKAHINRHLAGLTLGEVAPAVAHLLSCLFAPFFQARPAPHAAAGTEAATARGGQGGLHAALAERPEMFWLALRRRAWTRFGHLLPPTPLASSALNSVEGRFVLLRSLCAVLGLQLRTEVHARLQQQLQEQQQQQQQMPKWMLLLRGNEQHQQQQQQYMLQDLTGRNPSKAASDAGDTASDCRAPFDQQNEKTDAIDEQKTEHKVFLAGISSCSSSRGDSYCLVHAEDVLRVVPVLKGPPPPSQIVRALLAAASHCCSCGSVDAALDLLQQALCVAHQLSGAVCSEAASCYAAIGQLLGLLDDPLNACNNLQKSLILLEQCTGPDHPATIDIHSALAHGFSKLPGSVYRQRSMRHAQRALLLLHIWAEGRGHPMLPLMLLRTSRCVLQQQQKQQLQGQLNAQEQEHAIDSSMRCARAAEAALEGMQTLSPEYCAEVYCELSCVYESLHDWKKALDWARAALREYAKANADQKTMEEAEARMVRLTRTVVFQAQQLKLQQQQRGMLVSRLRHATELKRANNRANATALLACAGS